MTAAMRHTWARNRSTDGGAAASTYTVKGRGSEPPPATQHTLSVTITNEAFRFNIGNRLGLDAPGQDRDAGRHWRVPGTPTGIGMMNSNHLAQCARSSGVTATIEQARPADDAPRQARPMHTADVRVMDTEANTTWIDVMVTAAQPARPITDSLREAEQHKCRFRTQPCCARA